MRAAAIDEFGPPSLVTIHELPVPEPDEGEILIELHAAGVGVWDADIRNGWWPEGKPKFPLVMGSDGAGTVVAKGRGVRRFALEDRVWAYEFINPKGGFYAEYVAVNSQHVGKVPINLDLLHAGASAVTGLTALQGIDDQLRVRSRDTVLIFGATGAVGTLAIQFAKRRRARVIATASGRTPMALAKQLGADDVFDTRADDAPLRLQELAPKGLDAVLALAGGESLERCLDQVNKGGRVAYPNGVEPEPRRRRGVEVLAYDAVAGPREFARLERAAIDVELEVPLAAVYRLPQAAKAHARLEKGRVLGRIALQI